jgi:hypothetical protein
MMSRWRQGAEMVFQIPQSWDAAIDGIQIILCLFILLFLIRSRRKDKNSALEKAIIESGQSFNTQIFSQTLKQQVEEAWANIADSIAVEKRKLDKVLAFSLQDKHAHEMPQYEPRLHRPAGQEIFPVAGDAPNSELLHEQIQNLAAKGKSARQISEELKTPLGEVELVLSLSSSEGT